MLIGSDEILKAPVLGHLIPLYSHNTLGDADGDIKPLLLHI